MLSRFIMSTSLEKTSAADLLPETSTNQFNEALQIFDSSVQSQKLMCRIYEKYAGPDEAHHNCLGCNFNDLTEQVTKFLEVAAQNTVDFDLHHKFSIYAFLLNTCWERITDVFEVLGIPEGYRCRHFAPFIRIRRWANFFKHPKTFGWMVHHPHYTIENSDNHKYFSTDVGKYRFIDDEFLKKYYSSTTKEQPGKLRGEFTGFEKSTVVLIPDLVQITKEVCHCLKHFVEIVTENPVYVEMLNDTSTIQDYYGSVSDDNNVSYTEQPAG